MFGENHAHIFMNAVNYRQAVRKHENGVDEEVIHSHFRAYQEKNISLSGTAEIISRFPKERKNWQGNTVLTTERPFLPFTAKGTTEELWDGGLKI
ncbi:MAG: hypothetical protein ACLUB0_11295 [Blautia hansenii]